MKDGTADSLRKQLIDEAAALYRPAGRYAWHFARGKLGGDPLFVTLLRTGAVPDASCLVDLGCGQGLLAAWLHVARKAWSAGGAWPDAWPAAPEVGTWLGIDQSRHDIGRAQRALPPYARSFTGDVRTLGPTLLDRCDVATLFDVLQYLAPAAQVRLLEAVHAGLPPWGVLLMRVGDGAATLASRWSNAVDLVVCAARGHPRLRLNRRPVADWIALLERIGFGVEVLDDGRTAAGPKFANVLLRASRAATRGAGTRADVAGAALR